MVNRADKYTWGGGDIVFQSDEKSVGRQIKLFHDHHHHEHDHSPVLFVPEETVEVKTVHEEAIKELRAWQKFVYNGTATKRDFRTYMVREDIADTVNAAIETGAPDTIKAAFKEAERLAAIKANDDIRSSFESEIKTLIERGRSGELKRVDLTNRLKKLIREYGPRAFLAGLRDGGVIVNDESDFSTEDAAVVEGMLATHLSHARSLSEQIYKKGLSDAQARLKPRQWYGGVAQPFYDAGLLSAARDQMVEFVGPIDGASCDSCKALVGQRHRRRAFAAAGFMPPYGSSIICGDGKLCKHRLVSVNSRPRGNLSRVPRR